eukprot:TRINITY_DN20108_c0_g1_i3.p1 TRINITY_DN20108_c0_g1~~TRINITY_DN20108_c0_g1_i3.p1  ORF type:complete len:458 (+),score=107.50 TRINITY_DN20108_c0_g1_i3:77-1450(+)
MAIAKSASAPRIVANGKASPDRGKPQTPVKLQTLGKPQTPVKLAKTAKPTTPSKEPTSPAAGLARGREAGSPGTPGLSGSASSPKLQAGSLRAAGRSKLADGEPDATQLSPKDKTRRKPPWQGKPKPHPLADSSDDSDVESVPPPETPPARPPLPEKIWIQVFSPEGEETKVLMNRKCMVSDIRKAVCAMLRRESRMTEILLNDEVLLDARAQIFEDSQGPYELTWRQGDRLVNLLRQHGYTNLFSRRPGTRGLNRIALHWACLTGDVDLVMTILQEREVEQRLHAVVNAQDTFGDTPMLFAAILGFADIVEMLLTKEADPNARNLCGRSAIQFAAEHGHHEVVRALLRAGAEHGAAANSPWKYLNIKFLGKMNKRNRVVQAIKDFEAENADDEKLDALQDFFSDAGSDFGGGGAAGGERKLTRQVSTSSRRQSSMKRQASMKGKDEAERLPPIKGT